jgi:CHAD domain-containing protein
MAEFLESFSSAKAYEQTFDTLKKLQSALGVVHDVVAAEQIVSNPTE